MQPMADMMEALGMVFVGMPSSRARRTRSVCVVALEDCKHFKSCQKVKGGGNTQMDPRQRETQHRPLWHSREYRRCQSRRVRGLRQSQDGHSKLPTN